MLLRRKGNLILLLLSLFLLILFDRPMAAANIQDLEKINELIEETKEELSQKKREERSVLDSLIKAQKELDRIENDLDYLNTKIRETEKSISSLEKELDRIEREREELEEQGRLRQEKLNQRLVAAYKYGVSGYFEMLFSAESFADLVSKFETLSYFLRNDLTLLRAVEETREKIIEKQKEYEARKSELQAQRNRYAGLRKSSEKKQRQKAVMIGNTKEELRKINSDLKKLEAALDELERTSREIEAQIRRKQQDGVALGTGSLIWPVNGRITSPFGWRIHPILRKKKYHSGIDLAVPSGTPVKAADSGKVLISGWNGGYGYFVAIDHGKGISTAYGHNSRLLVKEGDIVIKGEVIAKSGSTGLSTGPHLHFEVRENGAPVNPLSYLP